jgi:hypothetical protein
MQDCELGVCCLQYIYFLVDEPNPFVEPNLIVAVATLLLPKCLLAYKPGIIFSTILCEIIIFKKNYY